MRNMIEKKESGDRSLNPIPAVGRSNVGVMSSVSLYRTIPAILQKIENETEMETIDDKWKEDYAGK